MHEAVAFRASGGVRGAQIWDNGEAQRVGVNMKGGRGGRRDRKRESPGVCEERTPPLPSTDAFPPAETIKRNRSRVRPYTVLT